MSKKVRKMNSWSPNQLRNSIKLKLINFLLLLIYHSLNVILLLGKLASEEVREPKLPVSFLKRKQEVQELRNCLTHNKLELKNRDMNSRLERPA